MIVKILKTKNNENYWYKEHIGEYVEGIYDEKDLFVIYTTEFDEYGDKKYIYIQDTNYFKQLRKQKLNKIINSL